jgi:HK97 family phage major capsid protein
MEQADIFDQAASRVAVLKGDFNRPLNTVPVADTDIAAYNQDDSTRRTKSDYKPASWVKGLPASSQPMWVQDQMGQNQQDDARVTTDAFHKWMRSPSEDMFWKTASPDEIKAMQEDTDAEGGFFVPEQFINQTIHDPGVPGSVTRPIATVLRVSSKDGYVPTMGSATWAAIAEEASFSDSTPTVAQVAFSVEKSGGLVKVTRELLDDSAINLPALLTTIFSEAAGRFEDAGVLNGNNTAQYDGILGSAAADYVMASATAISAADLLGIYYTLGSQFRGNASWVMPSLISKAISGIAATAAGVHAINSLTEAPAANLLGRPVVHADDTSNNGLSTALAANNEIAIFGDFSQYYIFDRVGFTIRRNDSLYMGNDQVGFFATRRGDGQVALATAFKILKLASS